MKLRRIVAAAVTAVTAFGVSVLGPSALAQDSPTAAGGYVALGDSYSSGVGAGSYDDASGDCRRSNVAYPVLWANANASCPSTSPPARVPGPPMCSTTSSDR